MVQPGLPRTIWILWFQGWHIAPKVVNASLNSWISRNPRWHVYRLDNNNLNDVLPSDLIQNIKRETPHPAAQSDRIRIELLARYGGVWVDATTICMAPLDEWLPEKLTAGFFAFSAPSKDRPLASWFLAACRGNYIIREWREATRKLWANAPPAEYFWFHELFAEALQNDPKFRRAWDAVPKVSAKHGRHFGPNPKLAAPTNVSDMEAFDASDAPVAKLTHKVGNPLPGTLLAGLIEQTSHPQPPRHVSGKRVVLNWYGTIPENGTLGDLLSVEAVATYLVAQGHDVLHTTDFDILIPGTRRVALEQVQEVEYDAAVFVCGPIMKNHKNIRHVFEQFRDKPFAGIGVSLFDNDHWNFFDPFDYVIARQRGDVTGAADVAILAPDRIGQVSPTNQIGVCLRGAQGEYGADLCRWRETNERILGSALAAVDGDQDRILEVDTHLFKSGMRPDEIENAFASCCVILTTRFHGAMIALRLGRPFIAIDQIQGGAKVWPLLSRLDWPHVYRVDDLPSTQVLQNEILQLMETPDTRRLDHTLVLEREEADKSLEQLEYWIKSLPMRRESILTRLSRLLKLN